MLHFSCCVKHFYGSNRKSLCNLWSAKQQFNPCSIVTWSLFPILKWSIYDIFINLTISIYLLYRNKINDNFLWKRKCYIVVNFERKHSILLIGLNSQCEAQNNTLQWNHCIAGWENLNFCYFFPEDIVFKIEMWLLYCKS